MTIDEAIRKEKTLSHLDSMIDEVKGISSINFDYHKQLAEWLEELKQLRFFRQKVMESEDGYLATMCERAGYNKAIDDFVREIALSNCLHSEQMKHIRYLSEQLKGENDGKI